MRAEQQVLARDVPFVEHTPWNHFGRKNVGYLLAIAAGAENVYDFDDDNGLLKNRSPMIDVADWIKSHRIAVLNQKLGAATRQRLVLAGAVFNPYPAMGATQPGTWPRGFPLSYILEEFSRNVSMRTPRTGDPRVGVWQSTANHDPDVDAMYRLTRPLPFSFSKDIAPHAIAVPQGVFAPYNAQAQVSIRAALWALYLPVTVPGRVSDIFRSYMAQRLFWDVNLTVAFTPPIVVQYRNAHDYLADLDAEHDLYFKTEALLHFLQNWSSLESTLAARIEELWVALYERDYCGYNDVLQIQRWLLTLEALGYKFPDLVQR
jgi:STELLO glycosyltransferases